MRHILHQKFQKEQAILVCYHDVFAEPFEWFVYHSLSVFCFAFIYLSLKVCTQSIYCSSFWNICMIIDFKQTSLVFSEYWTLSSMAENCIEKFFN